MLFEFIGDQIDAFDGFLTYNEIFLFVDIIIIIHFFYMWLYTYKKTGWVIDLWHITLFIGFIISNFFQYPFISSVVNYVALGDRWAYVQDTAEAVLFINIMGYIFIYMGRWVYDHLYAGMTRLNGFDVIIFRNIKDKQVVRFIGIFCLMLVALFVMLQIKLGIFGNPRAFFLVESSYRALFNGLSATLSIVTTYFIIKILDEGRKVDKIIGAGVIVSTLFMGSRGSFMGALMTFVFFYIYKRNGKIKLLRLMLLFCGGIFLLVLVTAFRGDVQLQDIPIFEILISLVFYGNSFSDLRDGALFFSYNGDSFLYGKTYFAALMSFVPRIISEYRETWAIGVVTASTVGYDITLHPGLRISRFGEVFLNFGYIGVIFLGSIYGYFLRKYDCLLKKHMKAGKDISLFYSISFLPLAFIGGLFNSAGFFQVYVFIVLNLCIYLIRIISSYL